MILFLICVILSPWDFTFCKLEKLSITGPVLIYLYPRNTTESTSILKNWISFSDIYKENKNIFFISADCSTNNHFCKQVSVNNATFITINKKFYQKHNLINNSIQGLSDLYNKSLINQFSFCQAYSLFGNATENISYKYPTFILNFNDNSCIELSKYKTLFPQASFYIRNTSCSKNCNKIELCSSSSDCIPNSYIEPIDFVYDYLFDHFGDWNLNEVSKIRRRLVLIIYNDASNSSLKLRKHKPKRSDFEKYIHSYSQYFLFGRLPYSVLYNSISYLRNIDNTPFMLITNTKKTRFMIVDYTRLNQNQISDKLNAARQGFLELSMEYFFDSKYALQNGYNPQNTAKFAFAALSVITLTAFLILLEVNSCVHMNNHKSMNMNSL